MQTIRRDWLMRQVEKGLLEARCDLYLERDGDGRSDHFGKTTDPWKPARIRRPKFEPREMPGGFRRDVCVDDDCREGYYNMHVADFSHGSRVWANDKNGPFTLHVHSNLSIELRYKQ